ncbi:YqzL family protein [Romboutsia sp. CE17]|uniref:YqzL family protein n=1 Tax=Romboutsia sp. CE17 TaxID=2724150 RepID=UPI001442D8CF|nr:YqzL family protein [Romboutsia sp. CE17]QJA08018.1 YqzL family protein [Romboutsia sp. CE17]
MNNLCWDIFKKTGSIEAFLYLNDFKNINEENNQSREIDSNYDNLEHPRDSS